MHAISKGAFVDETKSSRSRILDHGVDILAKVLSLQELPKKSASAKNISGHCNRLLARNADARLAGIVI